MLNVLPLAYKFVVTTLMLAEINHCASRMHLPMDLPVKEQDVRFCFLSDPTVTGFGGRIDTEKYSFAFSHSGKLRFITRVDEREGLSVEDYFNKMAQTKSKIGRAAAYRMATNWLWAIDVDVKKLEKEKPSKTEQRYFIGSPPFEKRAIRLGRVDLPLFYVTWGDRVFPTIKISISGATGELLFLRQEDASYSGRPADLVRDIDKLRAIPDEEFSKYSKTERLHLVRRFSVAVLPQTSGTNSAIFE